MRMREKRRVEKEWRQQEELKRRRQENRERVMMERKCFFCEGFGYITCNCRNRGEGRLILMPSNKFEVLKSRVMNIGEGSGREIGKDRKTILREKRLKKEKLVEV